MASSPAPSPEPPRRPETVSPRWRSVGRLLTRMGVALAALAAVAVAPAEIWTRAYGPLGTLKVARPTLVWEIWSEGDRQIRAARGQVSGRAVTARYVPERRRVEVELTEPLPPGKHQVELVAEFDGGFTVPRKWEFEVSDRALGDLPLPSEAQSRAIAIVNAFRERTGLPPMLPAAQLCAAAQGHSDYHALNRTTGHGQRPDRPGFFGADLGSRVEAFGYVGDAYETMAAGSSDPVDAVRGIFDAPYHRIPFLQPGVRMLGAGVNGTSVTLVMESRSEGGLVVSPADGETAVPTLWNRPERPNPLRIHPGVLGATGYPIVVAYFAPDRLPVKLVSAALHRADGEPVEVLLNHPGNDRQLDRQVFLIPRRPLLASTEYAAKVELELSSGERLQRVWRFRTQ